MIKPFFCLIVYAVIAGFEIKKGWHVNIDAAYIHYDPALYKDPELFNPSRFEVSGFIFLFFFS